MVLSAFEQSDVASSSCLAAYVLSYSMLSRTFVVCDDDAVSAVSSFPLHRFDSPPIAYLPIKSATHERFFIAIESNGCLSCFSPTIHTIHSVTRLLSEEAAEDVTICGIAVCRSELCIVLWDAKELRYNAHFLKAQRSALAFFGSTMLSPPNEHVFFCGVTHLGDVLCVVWSDGSIQCYKPQSLSNIGLVLCRTFRLTGFDFRAMSSQSTAVTTGVNLSVCSNLNTNGTLCVIGPQETTLQLRYTVLDVASGLIQDTGVINGTAVKGRPIKIMSIVGRQSEFRLFIGDKDCGVRKIKVSAATLAARIGVKRTSRKRKLDTDAATMLDPQVTLSRPHWTELMFSNESDPATVTERLHEKVAEASVFDNRVEECMTRLQKAIAIEEKNEEIIAEVLDVLTTAREEGKVLLIDLPGIAADYIGCHCRDWSSFRLLLSHGSLNSFNSCPALAQTLLHECQYDLFAEVLAGIQNLTPNAMALLLRQVLSCGNDDRCARECANRLDRIHSTVAAATAEAETVAELTIEMYERVKWTVSAVSGFSFTEILLHSVVSIPFDEANLNSALASLDGNDLRILVQYLHKWMLVLRNTLRQPNAIDSLECIRRIPSLQQILNWISSSLSIHAMTVISDVSMVETLTALREELQKVKPETKVLMTAYGLCKEILQTGRKTERKTAIYQVELLDMSLDE